MKPDKFCFLRLRFEFFYGTINALVWVFERLAAANASYGFIYTHKKTERGKYIVANDY